MSFVLKIGAGYVIDTRLTFGIPRLTLNPAAALEMPLSVALALQARSALSLELDAAWEPRPDYTPRATKQGLRRDLVEPRSPAERDEFLIEQRRERYQTYDKPKRGRGRKH